jgi:ABC-type lipoprotein export system ATPase subunit
MTNLSILPGKDRVGKAECFDEIRLERGNPYSIVGSTGSGKSRLIKDIEQLVDGDSITGRRILLDGQPVGKERRNRLSNSLIAHLGQNMKFVLDISIEQFIGQHASARGLPTHVRDSLAERVIATANRITQEPIFAELQLSALSGGQSRALMASDIAHICDSPVVLIDEIENAGIDKHEALQALVGTEKLVLLVTHDPHTALMAGMRIVLDHGGIVRTVERDEQEQRLFLELETNYRNQTTLQQRLRRGEHLA